MYKDKQVPVEQYINRREEINARLNEIADLMEAEKREASASELAEIDNLKREKSVIDLKISGADSRGNVTITARELAFDAYLRKVIENRSLQAENLKREAHYITTSTTNVDGMIPVTINKITEPLEEGLILDKVGLPLLTGLSGSYLWPVGGNAVEATIAGETVELQDAELTFNKVTPVPTRVGITVPITHQTITQTEGIAYEYVMRQIPQAIKRTLNAAMFNTAAGTTYGGVQGPFQALAAATGGAASTVAALNTKAKMKACYKITAVGSIPTYAELKALKGIVLVKGVPAEHLAYVMDAYTASVLEATSKDSGSGQMIIQNGAIDGIPVYTTNYINNATKCYVGFGNFGYEPLQGFGAMRFVVDPYTGATKDIVRITLNSDWAANCLKQEAFAVIELATA